MRLFWIALAVSAVMAAAGIVSLSAGVRQYTGAMETFTQLTVQHEEGSFRWLDPEFRNAQITMVITNDSPANAVVENINAYLRFNGRFAGTNYDRFEPVSVPRGETRTVELDLLVSITTVQDQGGTATLSLGGLSLVTFEGVDRQLRLNLRDQIGVVPYHE